eukprot:13173822-Ditylum_brightwellii.AAC.1
MEGDDDDDDDDETKMKIEEFSTSKTPLFIVAHSYGPSQTLHALSSILDDHQDNNNNNHILSPLKGLIFLSGSLQDAPNNPMRNAFVQQAFYKHTTSEKLKQEALSM